MIYREEDFLLLYPKFNKLILYLDYFAVAVIAAGGAKSVRSFVFAATRTLYECGSCELP